MTQLDQSVLASYRQSLASQIQPKDTGQGFVGDVVDATQKGAYDGLAGIGETFGADGLRDWAQEGANEQLATMSDAGKEALNKQFFTEENGTVAAGDAWTSPRAIAMQIGHVVGMNADILAGGAAVKGGTLAVTQVAKLARGKVLARKGTAEMAEAAAQKATETFLARKLGDKADKFKDFGTDILAYGAAGHAVGAGLQAIDLGNEVESLDFEDLEALPEYQNIVRKNIQQMPGQDAESILTVSRSELAEQARTAIKTNPTLLTSNMLIGGLGSAALTRILSGAMPRGQGVAAELMVEGAQGGLEQFAGNQVRQEFIDPSQDLNEGVTVSALNEAVLGGGTGLVASAVPAAVNAGRKWLGKDQQAPAAQPEFTGDPSADIAQPSAHPEMGPPAYPDLNTEFEAPTLDPIVNPANKPQSTFYDMAGKAATEHPEFVDGLVAVVGSDLEKAKAAISVLDKYMASPSYRVNAMNRLNEYLGVDAPKQENATPPAEVASQDAADFAHLAGVISKENPEFASQLTRYAEQNPQKMGVAIDTAAQWITNPAFRPKAQKQLAKFLLKPAANAAQAPVVAEQPNQDATTNVVQDDAYNAAKDFIGSYPIDKRGEIEPEILRDTFGLDDSQIKDLMPWRSLSTDSVGASVGNDEKPNEIKAVVEQAAEQAATSPLNDLPEPTDAQKEAGNYKKGHVSIHGLDIAIENAKGSERKGTDPKGKAWSVTMADHYGYIKRTEGADGDHVDVFIGDAPDSQKVYVVDQVNKDGSFDEHKVILGATDIKSAENTYKRNYSAGWQVGPIKEMDVAQFKDWLKNGDTKKPVTQREQWETTVADFGALRIERYSDKSVVVRGDTKSHKDALKNLKGTFNPRLKGGEGWIYANSRIDELKKSIPGILARAGNAAENAALSAAPAEEKPAQFKSAKQQVEALAQRAAADPALAKRIADILPAEMPASFDAGRVQAEIQKYEKQVALNEKREAIKAPQPETKVTAQPTLANQAGSKTPAPKTGDAFKDYWANSASESVKNTPPVTGGKKITPLFINVEASNARAAKLLQAKDDGFNIDKIWHRGSLFDASKYSDSNDDSFFGKGFYLTSDPQEAEDYASTDVTRNMDYTVNAEKLAKAKGITYSEAKAELSSGEKTVAEFVVKAPALLTIGDKGLVFKGRPIDLGAVDIEDILSRAGVSDEEIERLRTQWERVANNDRKLLDNLVGKDGTQGQGYIELLSRRKALPAMREIALSLGADAILMKDGTAPTKQTRKGAEHLVILKPQAVMNISSKPFNDDPATHPKMTLGEVRPRPESVEAAKPSEEPAKAKAPDYAADLAELSARADATDDWGLQGDITKLKKTLAELSTIAQAEKLDDIEERIVWEERSSGIKSPPHKQRWEKIMGQSPATGKPAESETQPAAPKSPVKEPVPSKLDAAAKMISDKKLEKAEKLAALLKSRKGQLNSGVDPEIMIAVAEVGALSIAEGAVKFAQWVRDVMATTRAVGISDDDVKPFLKEAYGAIAANPEKYGVSDDAADEMDSSKDIRKQDVESLLDDSDEAVEDVSEPKALDDEALQKVLLAGFEQKRQFLELADIKDNRMLREAVGKMLQIPAKEVSNIQLKAGQEAYEVVSMKARRMILRTMFSRNTARETSKHAAQMYAEQPNLNMRSANSSDMQAYSTPAPMAFIANVAAGVNTKTRVYEPTAGNGLLMMLNHPKNTFANELDPIRADALAWSGFNVTVADGSMNPISSGLVDGPVDVVLANPPFGKLRDSNGKPTKYTFTDYRGKEHAFGELDHVIAAESLTAMKDDGKAVLILGAAKEAGEYRGNNKAFLNWLYSNYNVVHHVEADGSLFKRQGAAWPTQMIVIYGRERHGTGKFAPLAEEIKRYEKWSTLYDSFDQAGLMGAASDGNTETFGNGRVLSARYATGERGISPRSDFDLVSERNTGNDPSGQKKPGTASRTARVDGRAGDSQQSDGAFNSQPDLIESGLVEAKTAPAAESGSAGYTRGTERVGLSGKRNVELKSIVRVNAFQAEYPTQSQGKNDHVLTPINIASYTQKSLEELSAKHPGGVDGYVQEKLGYKNSDELHDAFLGLQVDAVALGIHAIESGRAIIIGDQTGIGKGRQAAAVIRYAMKQGKVPVFITQKVNLFTDMYDDLHDIGVSGVRPLVMNADEGITKDEKVLFKLPTKERQSALRSLAKNRAMPDGFDYLSMTYSQIAGDRTGEKTALLKQIADNAIFVLDEAHTAAGQESKLGVVFQDLVGKAAGVTYLSATYAKRPDNMLLYTRTDLGLAMETFDELVSVVDRGGIGMMTYIAGKLSQAGQMIRRERSFDGINIDNVFLKDTGGKIKKQFDAATEALRAVQDLSSSWKGYVQTVIAKDKQREGGFDTSVAGNQADSAINVTLFSSVVHNYISQLTLAIKAKHIAAVAIAQHKAGERPVIALDNTMGSALEDYMELARLSVGERAEGFDFAELLTTMADRVLAYSIKEPGQAKGTKVYVPISQIKDANLKNLYKKVKKSAQALKKYDIAASPIDVIRSEIERAGLSVAEVTGRTLMIDYNDNAVIKQKDAQEKKDRRRTVDAFNAGALDVLILNQAGSTGLSIHAKETYKDRKPRHMIVAQPSLDINTFMQMLGRVNRTGQVVKPSYSVAWLPLPSEKRPAAVLSGKMRKLNANTSGNDKSATSIESMDLLNPYGNAMVDQYVQENRAELAAYNEKLIDLPEGDEAVYFLGKLAVCPVDMQERVISEVEALYRQYVAYLDATGQNELSTDFVDLDAKPIAQKLISDYKPGRGVFSEPAYLTQVDVKTSGKAPSWQEVQQELSKTSQADFDAVVQAIEADTAYYDGLRTKYDEVFKAREEAEAKGDDAKNLLADLVHLTGKVQAAESERTNLKYEMRSGAIYSHGSRIRVKMDGYEHPVTGVIVGVDYGHKPGVGNPAAPSKISFKVMLADRSRTIPLSLSQARNGIVEGVAHGSDAAIEAIFNHVSKMPQREERYIMTGNLLAAQHLSISKGRIIPFTTQDGRVIQGLLMPLSFTPETGIREDYHATIEDLLAWFKQADSELAGIGLSTSSKDAAIYREGKSGRYVLQLPRSASKGKPFWGNPDVEKVIGRQAFSGGGTVLLKVAPEKLDDLVMAINRVEPLGINAEGQIKDLKRFMGVAANEFSKNGIVFSKENRIGAKPAKGVPAQIVEREAEKILKQLQGAAGIRVKVLKTQAEAEAIWQMKLDGEAVRGAYSKKTRTAYVIAENIRNMSDLQQTLAHEIVAHGGLDTVIGADAYNDFINKIQKTRTNRSFASMWQQIDRDYEGSTERDKAEEVFAYYVQHQPIEPNIKLWWAVLTRWVEKALQKVGLLPAGAAGVDAMQDMIHSIRLGFAAGRARQSVKDALAFQLTGSSRLGMHFKDVVKRVPELKSAAQKMKAGELSAAEYELLVNEYKPVTPYASTPGLATTQEMQKALDSNKVAKIGEPYKQLATGDVVGLRLDIPSYSNHGVWVVSVHEGKKGGKGGAAGKVIGYDSAAMVSNPNMGMAEKSTLQIAAGESKGTIATIGGAWVSKSPDEIAALAEQALTSKDWVQVGMDPERHSYFYDRKSMEPVVSGEEAIQVGGLVLVKNPVYGRKGDFLFSQGSGKVTDSPDFKRWFGDSKVVDENGKPLVMYRGQPGWVTEDKYPLNRRYFTSDPEYAGTYVDDSESGVTVVPVYIRANKIKFEDDRGNVTDWNFDEEDLRAQGYDAIATVDLDIVYPLSKDPAQVKSAIGNDGNFSATNPDILFSKTKAEKTGNAIADAVSQINAERMQRWAEMFKPMKIWDAVKTKWPDWRPAMLQLLPRNYLADIGGDVLPSLRRYNNQVAEMEAQRNNLLNMTHGTADKWRKLVGKDSAASAKLADLMHEATLIGVDPSMDKFYPSITRQTYQMLMSRAKAFIKSRNGEAEAVSRGLQRRARIQAAMDKVPVQEQAYDQLRAEFLALPAEYQQMFIEVRDSYLEMNRERKKALEQRIEDLIADKRIAAAQISMMREEFELNELNGIYFPLQRFGKYRAVVKDRETGEVHSYSMFETNAQMQQWMAEQRGDGVVVDGGYQFEYSKMMDGVSAGFMKDLLLKFSPVFSQNSKIQDDLYQLFLEHSPDLSVRKHMIHRKGVSGYDQDALRAFAHNQFHTAYQIAKVSNTHHMQSHILAMEDEARALVNTDDKVRAVQVVNELQQRNEWILNPKGSEWASKLTGWGFFWYLGTTPAAALVNITQTAMVGLPVLGARYTYKEAASMLASTSAAFFKGKGNVDKTLTGRELSAFRQLEESGIIDKTMAHDMTGIADGGVAYSPKYHKVMQYAGFMFHHAERFNREVTAMAAYKLAFAKFMKKYAGQMGAEGIAHREAVAEAIEMTKLSHFDYANSNRPRFMQGDMARVILLFRQHSVNMTYRLIRDTQQSIWGRGEDKKVAQKQLAGMLGMTMLFAGAAGLPLYSVIAGIFNTMLDDEDEPFDFDAAVKEHLAEAIGDTAASVIMNGAPGTATGADLTNRIGMNNLWFRDPEADVEGEAAVQYYAEQALGPMYGILAGWGKAKQLAREGHTGRAWEAAVPKFARDLFKSTRYAEEGVLTKRGDPILDELSPWQIALQANGFTPLEVSQQYGANNALATSARRITDRRKLLLNRYALARRNGDNVLVAETLMEIEAFNQAQPTMKITAANRVKSLEQRQRLSDRSVNGVILSKKLAHLAE